MTKLNTLYSMKQDEDEKAAASAASEESGSSTTSTKTSHVYKELGYSTYDDMVEAILDKAAGGEMTQDGFAEWLTNAGLGSEYEDDIYNLYKSYVERFPESLEDEVIEDEDEAEAEISERARQLAAAKLSKANVDSSSLKPANVLLQAAQKILGGK